jgi:hypothetical protein
MGEIEYDDSGNWTAEERAYIERFVQTRVSDPSHLKVGRIKVSRNNVGGFDILFSGVGPIYNPRPIKPGQTE